MTDAELGASIRAIAQAAFEYGLRRVKTEWLTFGPLPAGQPASAAPPAQAAPPPAAAPVPAYDASRPAPPAEAPKQEAGTGKLAAYCDSCSGYGFTYRSGVSKLNGRPYSGFYCNTKRCKGNPVPGAA